MIKSYFRKNRLYLVAFIFINTIFIVIGMFFLSRIEFDEQASFRKSLNLGDIVLINKHDDFIIDNNKIDLIATGKSENLRNPFLKNNTNSGGEILDFVPIFFIEDMYYLEYECIMDYETYIFNNNPEYISIINTDYSNEKIIVKVSDMYFSDKPGVYLSKKLMDLSISKYTFYYSIILTDLNIDTICEIYKYDSNIKIYCFQGNLIDFYNEKRNIEKNDLKISYVLLIYLFYSLFVNSYLFLLYHKKNLKDYRLLYVMGERDFNVFMLSNSIILTSILISAFFSLLIINITLLIYNNFTENIIVLSLGNYSNLFLISLILFEIVSLILIGIFSIFRGKKNSYD